MCVEEGSRDDAVVDAGVVAEEDDNRAGDEREP
jgi:hypothetical protein